MLTLLRRICELWGLAAQRTLSAARQLGIAVTFMAKPVFGQSGSSCHIHVSLWNADGSSAFYDPAYDVIPCCVRVR